MVKSKKTSPKKVKKHSDNVAQEPEMEYNPALQKFEPKLEAKDKPMNEPQVDTRSLLYGLLFFVFFMALLIYAFLKLS